MKKSRKMVSLIVCVVLILALGVAGTIAYLMDSQSVTNTFTVGQVGLGLEETKTNEEGQPVDEDGNVVDDLEDAATTPEGNEYHLLPGHSYLKDPTITVKANSEESYVRMILTVTNAAAVQAIIDKDDNFTGDQKDLIKDYADLFDGWDDEKWIYEGFKEDTEAGSISFEFRYATTVVTEKDTDLVLEPLFTALVIPGYVNNTDLLALEGKDANGEPLDPAVPETEIIVEGHAIQAAGFVDADTTDDVTVEDIAWAAFDGQYAIENPEEPAQP